MQPVGPAADEEHAAPQAWWKVMCLTGVDYFSTLAYLPGIAALAAGALSPLATLLIVALTLLGMLPMYRRVAGRARTARARWRCWRTCCRSGAASCSCWSCSASSRPRGSSRSPCPRPTPPCTCWRTRISRGRCTATPVAITVLLLLVLGGVFLLGFSEAVGVAIPLVAVFLLPQRASWSSSAWSRWSQHRVRWSTWRDALTAGGGGVGGMVGPAVLAFPLLVLGLSGFETGVSMMPLVAAEGGNAEQRLRSRIRNTRKLLTDGGADHVRLPAHAPASSPPC